MPIHSAGWRSTDDPDIVRWWDGHGWQERYGSVLETGTQATTIPRQIYELERRNIDAELLSALRITELENQVGRLTEERNEPVADIVLQVTRKQQELLAIQGRIENARFALTDIQNQVDATNDAKRTTDLLFQDYSTIADSSAKAMEEIRSLRKDAKASIRSGDAYKIRKRELLSEEGERFSLAHWQAVKIADELLSVLNRHVEIEASRTTGDYDTVSVHKSFLVLTELSWQLGIDLSDAYFELRTKELHRLSDYRFLKSMEKEQARYDRAEAREEALAQKELERETAKLEKDLEHHFNALDALQAKGDDEGVARVSAAIKALEKKLDAIDLRALNLRTGYVYVISNIGAFGTDIVKIGLTRRLDPLDRISELSSASVPYRFDVHALFFSEDAVGIEKMLHHHFDDRRVNLVNRRKEFFHATPSEVLAVLREHQVELIDWSDEPNAFEYRLGLRKLQDDRTRRHEWNVPTAADDSKHLARNPL